MIEIMVVDDDQDLLDSVAEVLGGAGYSVTQVSRGEEALEYLASKDYDLILLDLVMPGLGGLELLGRIRDKAPRMPVIMITAFASVENAVAAMRQGASDYVTKPFRIDGLLVTVGRVLEEIRFESCRISMNLDTALSCLANPIRREILAHIQQEKEGALRFMDICRRLELGDHTKLNFHLKTLKDAGFLDHDEHKRYLLTPLGTQILEGVRHLLKKLAD